MKFPAVLLAMGLAMTSQAHAGPSFLEAAAFYFKNVQGLKVQRAKDATVAVQENLPGMSCHKDYWWSGNRVRRLNALEYIRDNFCMGLPQPDPMPY